MKYTKKLISCKIQGLKGKKSTLYIGIINGLKQCISIVLQSIDAFTSLYMDSAVARTT